jgi:D-alanyl-lipoteichoic acid acyltransferase DltB (MBOAT superfamily)
MSFIPHYIFLLLALIVIDYGTGIALSDPKKKQHKKTIATLAILIHILVFIGMKYLPFLHIVLHDLATVFSIHYTVPSTYMPIPIGLSFHLFQSIAYIIDVYKGTYTAQKNPIILAEYILFFPQLLAGPIERPKQLMQQLEHPAVISYPNLTDGGLRILWGIGKKVLIADTIALFIDPIWNTSVTTMYSGFTYILAAVLFSFQIYADFSGYTDIAIGSAKLFGVTLTENFSLPYLATSIHDFWKRWHISLTSWFRDYVYIPLGGNRSGIATTIRNTSIVFFISGLWHGAGYSYLIWGCLHGAFMIIQTMFQSLHICIHPLLYRITYPFRVMLTILIISIIWIPFRIQSVPLILSIWRQIISINTLHVSIPIDSLFTTIFFLFIMIFFEFCCSNQKIVHKLKNMPFIIKQFAVYALIAAIIVFGNYEVRTFIYFQF